MRRCSMQSIMYTYRLVYRVVTKRVQVDLQEKVEPPRKELERVQRKSSKQETKLDDIRKKYKILKSDYDSLSSESNGTL